MRKLQYLTGQKFGKLTVINFNHKIKTNYGQWKYYWLCECECGNTIIVCSSNLKTGHTKSCGCLKIENTVNANKKHGLAKHRLYKIWENLKFRCLNKKCNSFKNYGNRGITVCIDWLNNFENFYTWAIANGYKDDLTIDRIDNNGNYESDNCRWVNAKKQANNRRSNRLITYNNETHTLSEWANKYNIKISKLWARLNSGWTIEKSLTTP